MVAPCEKALYLAAVMIRAILIGLIWIYRGTLSPFLTFIGGPGSGCRYTPTCSEYAIEAIQVHGALQGVWMTFLRISRCHPWGGFGYDPVMPAKKHAHSCNAISTQNTTTN